MKRRFAVLLALMAPNSAAIADSVCNRAMPLLGPVPAARSVMDGLAAGSRSGHLAVWPVAQGSKLNAELGVEVEFADQSRCVLALDEKTMSGFSVAIGSRRVTAVEAAICDESDGMCVPVRLMVER